MTKEGLRQRIWALLTRQKVTRFPGAEGRIPNFVGAEKAAAQVQKLRVWEQARTLKVNPDSPQRVLRSLALQQGKTVYMAVPRLREERCFFELRPERLRVSPQQASSIGGAATHGRAVRLEDVPCIDLVVCGSVAVNRKGARLGKGGGYSDLEYALLAERGRVTRRTAILTTVHFLQLVDEDIPMFPQDISLDFIITPGDVIRIDPVYPRPRGISWELLSAEKLAAVPVLRRLKPGS